MTLLTIIQDVANSVGIDSPSTVIGNSDSNTERLLQLSNLSGKLMANRFPFQELTREWTLTTTATEDQGALETIMPGFNWDLYGTMWNRSTKFPVTGPLYPPEWQFLKALAVSGPWPQFMIRGGHLLCIPVPTAGDTYAGEYISRYWCQSSGGTGQERWAADTDTGVLSEDVLTLDLIWRWKRSQGLDYAEEKMDSELFINQKMTRNGSNRILNLEGDAAERDWPKGISAQAGNWPLT